MPPDPAGPCSFDTTGDDPIDEFDFQGTGETIVLALDSIAAGSRPIGHRSAVRFSPQPVSEPEVKLGHEEPMPASSPASSSAQDMLGPPGSGESPPPPTREGHPAHPIATPGRPAPPNIQLGVVAFAGFGAVPATVAGLPAYALRVMTRRRALRRDLSIARAHRSPDVELYAAALRTADEAAVRKGVVLLAALLGVAIGLFAASIAVFF